MKVKSKTSLSSKIIDVWMENQRKVGAPWKGPLPKPSKSPLHIFGNVLASAMKNHSHAGKISTLTINGGDQDQSLEPCYRSW
jgi:hypothetical protein